MNAATARALAQAYELQLLLQDIEERDGNPRIENAIDYMDDVIGELDRLMPAEAHGESAHVLRLLVTEPGQFDQHRVAKAMRRLSTMPWRAQS